MHEEQQKQQQRVAVIRDLEDDYLLENQKQHQQKPLEMQKHTTRIVSFDKLSPEQKYLAAKGIIRHNDRRKFWWDLWIIFLALYNCFFIPVEIAFEPPKLEQSILYLVVDILGRYFLYSRHFHKFKDYLHYKQKRGDFRQEENRHTLLTRPVHNRPPPCFMT